ncbi:MAG: glycosyltransferase [Alphaproteobacteria bacterium]|nr:glycosyltransferase [Alphaproteobacteria bacterium]
MTSLALLSLIGWLYLTFLHGRRFWQPFFLPETAPRGYWPSVTVIVPARDEAQELPKTLPSLLQQDYPGTWRVLLLDDHSSDGTADVARKIANELGLAKRLEVIAASEPKDGWTGKVSAMQAGQEHADSDFVLFTDADIRHPAHNIRRLVTQAETQSADLVSLMVKLHCASRAEKILIPAFVYFFQMLYPFRLANDHDSAIAAAAGGVMLVRKSALDKVEGLIAIRRALIDDCELAKLIKHKSLPGAYARTLLALSNDTESVRAYGETGPIWQMIARTAFTQLKHSVFLLLACVLGMAILFIAPLAAILFAGLWGKLFALLAIAAMAFTYLPMIRLYGLPPAWTLALPAAGAVYIGATCDSARLTWAGAGGEWKGRTEARR